MSVARRSRYCNNLPCLTTILTTTLSTSKYLRPLLLIVFSLLRIGINVESFYQFSPQSIYRLLHNSNTFRRHCRCVMESSSSKDVAVSNTTNTAVVMNQKNERYDLNNDRTYNHWDDYKDQVIETCIIPLSYTTSYKGSSGRVAIIGGNELYVGAPYFAAMAALQTGIDLVSIYTADEACVPLKCYSPDLMVQSFYRTSDLDAIARPDDEVVNNDVKPKDAKNIIQQTINKMNGYLLQRRQDCIVIGPGMGRHPIVMEIIAQIIELIIIPNHYYLIVDADALFMLSLPQYRHLLNGYDRAIITPNKVEYDRLFHDSSSSNNSDTNKDIRTNPYLKSVTIVQKGYVDTIYGGSGIQSTTTSSTVASTSAIGGNSNTIQYICTEMGGMKRCGGIGDVLAGTIATLIAWQSVLQSRRRRQSLKNHTTTDDTNIHDDSKISQHVDNDDSNSNASLACYTACCLVKRATKKAFDKKQRAMLAQDVINEIAITFQEMISITSNNSTYI